MISCVKMQTFDNAEGTDCYTDQWTKVEMSFLTAMLQLFLLDKVLAQKFSKSQDLRPSL